MAGEAPKPAIEVLGKTFTQIPDEKGVLQPLTHIVYRDENGLIGSITLPKKDPSDLDIKNAILKLRETEKARKPHIIPL